MIITKEQLAEILHNAKDWKQSLIEDKEKRGIKQEPKEESNE